MALFGFGKKKEETTCCCGTPASEAKAEPACCCGGGICGIQSIKVLGPGCKSCHELNEAANAAVKQLGMDVAVEYITDMETITSYGVMSMPALAINEKVVSMGKALKAADIVKLFQKLGFCR